MLRPNHNFILAKKNGIQRTKTLFLREEKQSFAHFRQYWEK
jgi:hypothetical protein